ncbi:hypothetical protein KA005_23235, partial [bacterium]|nr:hypothetical protein [bacterium]
KYISDINRDSFSTVTFDNSDSQSKSIRFTHVAIEHPDRNEKIKTDNQEITLHCRLEYQVIEDTVGAVIAIRIDSLSGIPVMTLTDNDLDVNNFFKNKGSF